MKILNIMFGKGRGGLEQVQVDYHEALTLAGHEVINVTYPSAWSNEPLRALNAQVTSLAPLGEWDALASLKLRRLANKQNADLAICHGNRAIGLALRAFKKRIPVVGVAHNYKLKRFTHCDGVFCITRDLIEECVHRDIPRNRLRHIPNMVRIPDGITPRITPREPLVIGSMGRFVEKKGFHFFIGALSLLKQRGLHFTAQLGGDGLFAPLLQDEAQKLQLQDQLTFTGWVQNKADFFAGLDVFVLPSLHEPFGIVLLEAMAHGVPCITTDSEGPCEIITHPKDALLCEKANAASLADAIAQLAADNTLYANLAAEGLRTAQTHYTIPAISKQLDKALRAQLESA